ncbi:hypothetical protein [Leptodesmis sp.]|uniref:hypothetical protein n=1 Tax=Leptodesmis sp. TaxID=3100501 RepID=UPI0040534A88
MADLLKTRPVVFWGGVWASIFLVSLVAVGCLLSPSASSNRTAAMIASDDEPAVETLPMPNPEGRVSVWMFGAIALTCTASSILITRYLKLASPTGANKAKRTFRALQPVADAQPGQHPASSRQLQPFSPTAPLPFPMLPTFVQSSAKSGVLVPEHQKTVQGKTQKPIEQRTIQEQMTCSDLIAWLTAELEAPSSPLVNPLDPFTTSRQSGSEPVVTVVPVAQSHPLDRGESRMAHTTNLDRLRSLQT